MFMVQLLLFADTALQKKKRKNENKSCCRTFMGITPGAYQHCCRALTPFSMLKKTPQC